MEKVNLIFSVHKNSRMNYYIGTLISLAMASAFAFAASSGSREIEGVPLLVILIIYIHAVQIIGFVIAKIFNTEKFYDLTGSLTYISSIIGAVMLQDLTLRQKVASGLVCLWALRLGSFLFYRVMVVGEDSRFIRIKKSTINFFFAWIVQGLWITITGAPAFVMVSQSHPLSDSQSFSFL